jgi:hypothetical protein
MILSSLFLRRALLADAVFSGVSAVVMTLDAGALAPFLNLPEALLRETGLFLMVRVQAFENSFLKALCPKRLWRRLLALRRPAQ